MKVFVDDLKRFRVMILFCLLVYVIASNGQFTYTYIDSTTKYVFYESCNDSLCMVKVEAYPEKLCLYNQGLCVDTIRISFTIRDTIYCTKRAFSYAPGHGVIGAVYECLSDTPLFIYVNKGIDSILDIRCSSFLDLVKEIFGDSIIAEKEKECRFLAYEYKHILMKKCLWKVYDSILIKAGIYGADMYALVIKIYCFSIIILSQNENIIYNISNHVRINADFSFCE